MELTLFDFEDGKGSVSAHRHINKNDTLGGWVADTAHVDPTVHVGKNARVYGNAQVYGNVTIRNNVQVYGNAKLYDNLVITDDVKIYGNSTICNNVLLGRNAEVFENAKIMHYVALLGNIHVYSDACISGNVIIISEIPIKIGSNDDYFIVGPFGMLYITFIRQKNGIYVNYNLTTYKLDLFKQYLTMPLLQQAIVDSMSSIPNELTKYSNKILKIVSAVEEMWKR